MRYEQSQSRVIVNAYHFRKITLVAVSLHVPENLVTEELRDLGCVQNVPLDVTCNVLGQPKHARIAYLKGQSVVLGRSEERRKR